MKNLDKIVETAKKVAKEDYVTTMKKIKAYNPHYKRKWRKVELKDGCFAFALEGTPDKAFVLVHPDRVEAKRQDMTTIKTFNR